MQDNVALTRWIRLAELDATLPKRVSGGRYSAIANILFAETGEAITADQVRGALNRWRKHLIKEEVNAELEALRFRTAIAEGAAQPFVSADDRRSAMQEYLGTSFRAKNITILPKRKCRKVLGVGDIHGDIHPDVHAAIINEQPDIYVLGGDLFNMAQASPHEKSLRTKTIRQESADIRAFLETLVEETVAERILVMRGNHDDWVAKSAAKVLDTWMLEFFTDPLDIVVEGLPRVEMVKTDVHYHHVDDKDRESLGHTRYMLVVGDALFSHMNFFGGEPGDAARRLFKWYRKWDRVLRWEHVTTLVQFHGHKMALEIGQGGWFNLVEPGMAGKMSVEEYKVEYKGVWGPGLPGYVVLEQIEHDGQWQTLPETIQLKRATVRREKREERDERHQEGVLES